jgi:hypothetical protein
VFDSPALTDSVEILGAPSLRVRVSCDRPVAHLAVRLCEVTPAGQSWLVSYGLLNLTHRDGHEHPAPLEPGRAYDVEVPLNFTAHRFAAGTRIRAALSESLWPLVWPSPEVATLSVDLAESRLALPIRSPPPREAPMPIGLLPPPPDDPKSSPAMDIAEADDVARVAETWPDSTSEVADIGEMVSGSGPNVVLSMRAGDPLSCAWSAEQSAGMKRPGWDVSIRATVSIRSTASDFLVEERTWASLNGEGVADVKHSATIPRVLE